jgi:hypothetical protein
MNSPDELSAFAILRSSKVVHQCDDRLLVLMLQAAQPHRRLRDLALNIVGLSLVMAMLIGTGAWYFSPPFPIIESILLWLILVVPLTLGFVTRGTVIANKDNDLLYIEWQNVITRRKKIKPIVHLSEIIETEVTCRIDQESELAPLEVYDVKVITERGSQYAWFSYSEETASAVASYLRKAANDKKSA